MKSPSSAFNTKLLKIAGEKPLILAKIYYGTGVNDFFLCSTERVKIGSNIYNPWVANFGSIRFSVDEDICLSPPNEVDITFFRNLTTANLLNPYAIGEKVILWQWIDELINFSTDSLAIGTFKIQSIEEIEFGNFRIRCVSDESRHKDIPMEKINKANYPAMNEDFQDQVWPFVLGNMLNPTGDTYRYLDTYESNAVPCFCIEKDLYKFLAYKHASIQAQNLGARAYKIVGKNSLYASLYSLITDSVVWSAQAETYGRIVDINSSDEMNYGNARMIRLLPEKTGADNNCSTWYRACDRDRDTLCGMNVTDNILHLGFNNIEGIGNFIPQGWTDNAYYRLKIALNIDTISGTLRVQLLRDSTVLFTEDFTTTGYKLLAATWSDPGGAILELSRFSIKVSLISGPLAAVDGVHIIVGFYDSMDVNQYILYTRESDIREVRKQGYEVSPIGIRAVIPEWKAGQIFVEMAGPQKQVPGYSWDYRSPCSHLYFILSKILETPDTEIHGTNWDAINTLLGSWWTARAIYQTISSADLLESLLRESFLKMWRDSENYYRLFRFNKAAASPDMVFSDKKESVYLIKNFNWGFTDNFYNRFDLKYKFDAGKNDYVRIYFKDRNNDSDLQISYENYSNSERSYPYPEFEWVRENSVMDLIYAELKKYWKQLKIWIEFDTSLVGCLLELGDTIQVDHSAQTWVQASKNFQVMEIEQDNNRFHIKAIEVIP